PAGPVGPAGPQGSSGILGVTTVESPPVTIPPGSNSYRQDPNSMTAQCPAGTTVVGTGVDTGIGNLDFLKKYGTLVGGFVDNDTSITIEATVQAICATLPAGVAATRSVHDYAADFQADAERLSASK
ncbi:MAG: hypothetical protein ACXVV5_16580, partial [Solirubrobacteraceae bacterium]